MLPDYPDLKRRIDEILLRYLEQRVMFHLGYFAQIKHVSVPEGCSSRLVRADGTTDQSGMVKISPEEEWNLSSGVAPMPEVAFQKLDSMAKQMAGQQAQGLLKHIREVTEEVGNALRVKMSEFGLRTLNDMLERVELDFDGMGRPILPSLVCGKEMSDRLMEQRDTADTDRTEQSRKDEIIARKREEFRDRESRRRLVD
ncbi:MAG: hypothetical protein PHR35_07795 [Kiritimatiellae bacterium]|nr:hypothetical protein [Kiritimatiellia bacterium]